MRSGRLGVSVRSTPGWNKLGDDRFHLIGADRIADAVRRDVRRGIYSRECWNADELALQVDQRAAAVAGVDRCARLDHPRQRIRFAIYYLFPLAVERADYSCRCRLL